MAALHEQHVEEQQKKWKRLFAGLALQRNNRLRRNPRRKGIQKQKLVRISIPFPSKTVATIAK